jgi:phage-related protein
MHKLFALVAVVLLAGCSTVDATYEGGKGVVNGVAEDGFGITSGTFDVISNVIKDVADKTGVDIKEDTEKL